MKNKKIIGGLLVLLILTALCVGGCTASKPVAEKTTSDQPATATSEPTSEPASEAPTLKGEQKIALTLGEGTRTLDPTKCNDGDGTGIIIHIFDPLVRKNEAGAYEPGAAKSWEVADDQVTYTLHLDPKGKWSDGKPVTADQFVYAMQRQVDPMIGSEISGNLFAIKNGFEIVNQGVDPKELGVRAIDDQTLEVVLSAPNMYNFDALVGVYPLRKELVEQDSDGWATNAKLLSVSNGAFHVSQWLPNDRVTVVKNEHFRNADEVKLEQIDFRFIPDSSTALSAYQAGDLDCTGKIPNEEIFNLMVTNPEFKLLPAYMTEYVEFNTKAAPFDDVNVRKAFTLAIDRKTLCENVLNGNGFPAASVMPEGYKIEGVDFREGQPDYGILKEGPNVKGAQEALAAAGYPNGQGFPKVTMTCESVKNSMAMGEAFAKMWKDVLNVDVELKSREFQIMYDEMGTGDFQMAGSMVFPSTTHPLSVLTAFQKGSGMNYTQLEMDAYDALVNEALATQDDKKAEKIMQKAEVMWMEAYPMAPLFHGTTKVLVKPYVKNYKVINTYKDFNYAYVEK